MNPFIRLAHTTAYSVVICREDVRKKEKKGEKNDITFKTLIPENVFKKDKCVFLHNMISPVAIYIRHSFKCRMAESISILLHFFFLLLCHFSMGDSGIYQMHTWPPWK